MDDVTAMAQQLRSDDQELLQGLLHTLQSRHAAGLVFTRLGSMLIALNPLRSLPQFCSREERTRHLRALDRELPPHIFELGTRALAAVASEGESQCISLLGPVGSGKTFLAQRLLQQLTLGAPGAAPLEEPLSRGNALLDFLGSVRTADVVAGLPPPPTATTPRTARAQEAPPPATLPAHLSTCFCRASLLYFRADGRVAVGRVHTVLLGRGGLLPEPPPPGAGLQREGLQCLRALLAIDPRLATDLHLTEARASRYVCGAPTEEDGQRVREASAAMAAVGMAAEQQRAVWRALAAVLHLGCLRAPPPAAPTAADEVAAPLRLAATLLGVSAEALHRALSSSHRGAASAAASAARDPAAAMAQAHYLPPTAYRLPLSSYHSPLTTHHSPLTTHHPPLTTHHSPPTTHHSPLTTHYSQAHAISLHVLCRLLDYVAEAINAALQQQLARLRPSDGLAAAPLLDLSTMPFVGVLEAPPAPRQAEGEVAGLPELLRAYGAERAWARVCAALRGALHEAPPLEGLEPLALPLPGGEAEVRRMLLEPHSLHPST